MGSGYICSSFILKRGQERVLKRWGTKSQGKVLYDRRDKSILTGVGEREWTLKRVGPEE